MSLVIGFGPLDENQTTYGANSFLASVVLYIFAVGVLFKTKEETQQTEYTLRRSSIYECVNIYIKLKST